MNTVRTVALFLVLLLALPLAGAHIEAFSQSKPVSVGPYSAIVEPRPAPMYANGALSMTAIFSRTADGTYATKGIQPSIQVTDAAGNNTTTPMQPDGSGYYVASVAFREPGNYTVSVIVKDAEGTYSNASVFTVYPDLPVRFRSGDPTQLDPVVGEPYAIAIDSLDPETLLPADNGVTDVTVTLERWSDDHSRLFEATPHAMTHAGVGRWTLDHTFPVKGMYHLRFASVSGGFKNDDVPILHVYANEPAPGSGTPGTRPVPLPWAGVLLALGAVALARRRP